MNESEDSEISCELTVIPDDGQVYCKSIWDSVSCLPTTLAGTTMSMQCPEAVDKISLDTAQNATRMCFENGTWEERTDYSKCMHEEQDESHNVAESFIYYIGFGTSTIALILALFIFLYFRSLRCLRNNIHCHYMMTFILRNVCWVINAIIVSSHTPDDKDAVNWLCKSFVTIFNYLQMTNYFWMFVEGLYLHSIIVWAFTADRIKLWHYVIIGWVIPLVFILVWIIVKVTLDDANNRCWLPKEGIDNYKFDWIFIIPTLSVLLINIVFLFTIIWIVITKLKASNTQETRHIRKAVKATVVLVPLLGLSYIMILAAPGGKTIGNKVSIYINSILLSTQGLVVAILYCFLNSEVRACVQKKFHRWKDSRDLATKLSKGAYATRGSYTRTSLVPVHTQNGLESPIKEDSNGNARNGLVERFLQTSELRKGSDGGVSVTSRLVDDEVA